MDPVAAANEPKEVVKPAANLPTGGIVMYCTTWCPECRRARLWLKEHNLPFTEVDIYTVDGAPEQVMKWAGGNKTTPTFDIDGQIVVKFDELRLREILKDKLR
ncbi:MAG: glutaredoxin family protein [Anaerolineaceae bacterium]|nr:glutaredoxin family protein [Anaerolineaceae bacterium]